MDSEAQGRARGGSSVWCGRVARVCAALSRALAARHDSARGVGQGRCRDGNLGIRSNGHSYRDDFLFMSDTCI
jgi:hypothetical protein